MEDENTELQADNEKSTIKNIVNENIILPHKTALNTNVALNVEEKKLDYNISYTYSPSIKSDVGNLNAEITGGIENDTEIYNTTLKYTNSIETSNADININTQCGIENGNVNYDISANSEIQTPDKTVSNVGVALNKDDSSISIGIRKPLLNPDNPNGIVDQTQQRKEELIKSGDKFNLQTKVGYSKNQGGAYTNNSLLYRVDNDNFLNVEYTESTSKSSINIAADLKKVKINANKSSEKEEFSSTSTTALDIKSKGQKNQYNLNITSKKTNISDENNQESTSTNITQFNLGAELNRTEYGEFNSGFNANYSGQLALKEGKYSGYRISLDSAYNYYGEEHSKKTDYLVRGQINFGHEDETTSIDGDISGALRFNNCRTIFEPGINYSYTSSPEGKSNNTTLRAGIWQQVGKNFGDATIFAQGGQVYKNTKTQDGNKQNEVFTELVLGANIKASKKVNFTGKTTWDNQTKWGGELSCRVSF